MSIRITHPTGSPFAKNAALAFSEIALTGEIVTCFAHPAGQVSFKTLERLVPILYRELGRRTWNPPPGFKIIERPFREAVRIGLARTGIGRRLGFPDRMLVDWVYRDIDSFTASLDWSGIDCAYAYEDGAQNVFRAAKKFEVKCYYDLPILHYKEARRIQEEEAGLRPDVAPGLAARFDDEAKLQRKDSELSLADRIIVPSTNVKRSLEGVVSDLSRVHVVPFGSPTEYFHPMPRSNASFTVLFVGQISPRKGVHYLLEAWNSLKLPKARLLLFGSNGFPKGWLEKNLGSADYQNSIPHSELGNIYQQADVFAFPSLVEGLALVQLEAMACGLPIITTINAGGDDLITDGEEGFIIPIRDVEALKEKILWSFEHKDALREMGGAARRKAESFSWQRYRWGLQEIYNLDFKPAGTASTP